MTDLPGRPNKSDLSRLLDSNQRTLLSSCSHALSHSFGVKGCQKMFTYEFMFELQKLLLQKTFLQLLKIPPGSQELNGYEI